MDNEDTQNRELESFFSELGERLELVADCDAKIARFEAPRFSLFNEEYIGREENKITGILKDLLDPKGSHGQGSIFLESFLTLIGLEKKWKGDLKRVHAIGQHQTTSGRYIDLTVRIGRHILGLENKINAGEERNQMHDYITHLRFISGDEFFVVFLTPRQGDSGDPTSCEAGEWEELRHQTRARSLSYADLSAELSSWAARCRSDRVRVLLVDMSEWAKRLTKGNERMATYPTTEAVKQFIVGHKEHLKTYTALLSAADAVESALIIDFAAGLESALRAAFGSQEWSVANNVDEGCFSSNAEPEILVRKHSWVGYAVGIAANSIGERFGYGVRREGRPRDESEDRIVKQLGSGMTGESPWFWYRYAPRLHGIDGSRWRNHESLKAMHDDETRSEILAELVSLIASVAKIVSRELEDNNVVMLQSNER